ncbi:MAG TPA: MaoC family dehydratase [Thermomicrobiales bacterium]|nr:MaoC family dehydratase [Thermomicrobiales bacterium]
MTRTQRHVVTSVAELREYIGKEINVSPWIEMTQQRVNQFADATGDHQYIHVDPERAKETFFGGTIAHGFLTLSMVYGADEAAPGIKLDLGGKLAVNYGLNKVRFPAPVPVGKRVRQRVVLANVEEIGDRAVQLTHTRTIEVEGSDKPACVAETLSRIYW